MTRNIYIPYEENRDINYCYIIMFYKIAEYNKSLRIYNIIKYDNIKQLTERLNSSLAQNDYISESTVNRILQNTKYKKFIHLDKAKKEITINNNAKNLKKFVILTDSEVSLILEKFDKLFAAYLLYLKYYYGYNKKNPIDTTQNQFLNALQYSTHSNSYKSKLSEFNNILSEKGYIEIQHYIDSNGYQRNRYAYR